MSHGHTPHGTKDAVGSSDGPLRKQRAPADGNALQAGRSLFWHDTALRPSILVYFQPGVWESHPCQLQISLPPSGAAYTALGTTKLCCAAAAQTPQMSSNSPHINTVKKRNDLHRTLMLRLSSAELRMVSDAATQWG